MIIHDTLDKVAEALIPEGVHPLLHVNNRDAWVNIIAELVINEKVKSNPKNIKLMAKAWEQILFNYYTLVN
jgi:hypothetical protein